MALTVGVDVGGTKIAAGVVDETGHVVATARRESPATNSEAIESTIAELVLELGESHDIVGVGVGAAGFIDVGRSTVLFAPNLAWRDEPLKAELERRTGLPVVIENDANAAAWGEFAFGAGADVEDLLLVTVGTGVGGGIVLDGKLHRGAFGIAAEIGHLRVVPSGRLCGCGNLGCWEQYASGSALVRDTKERLAAGGDEAKPLLDLVRGDVDALSGPLITAAALKGDPLALELVTTVAQWLGEGIASLTAVLDPAVVVIGGGVSEAGDLLLEPVREHFRTQLTGRGFRPELSIRPAELGNRAGMIGAADLARRA